MKRLGAIEILVFVMLLLPGAVVASPVQAPVPYVKPSSLWPFHALEGLLVVLGFFAAYRAIRSKLPPGDDVIEKQEKERQKALRDGAHTSTYEADPVPMAQTVSPPAKNPKAKTQAITVLRGAGLLFMAGGSALAFNSGGIDYGPLHLDEDIARIFGGALFVVGLTDFFLLPKLMAGKMGTDRL
jgi:hypothetical protein